MMIARFNRLLLRKFSDALEPGLREAVLGDIEELNISEGRALWELLGLLLRRQTEPWWSWKPWLALFCIALPISWLLTNLSRDIAFDFFNHAIVFWKYGVFYGTGLTGPQEILTFVCQSLGIALWSWTAGWILAALSDKAAWMNGTLFCLVCFFRGSMADLTWHSLVAVIMLKPLASIHRSLFFFLATLVIYPAVLFLFLLFPAFSGIRSALRRRRLGMKATILLAAATATLTTLVTLTQGWQFTALQRWSLGAIRYPTPGWEERLLPLLILSWPAAYLLRRIRDGGEVTLQPFDE